MTPALPLPEGERGGVRGPRRGRDMSEDKPLRVAIGGFGAIGKTVARRLDRGIDGLALAAVAARDPTRAAAAMADFLRPVPVVTLAELGEAAHLFIRRRLGERGRGQERESNDERRQLHFSGT